MAQAASRHVIDERLASSTSHNSSLPVPSPRELLPGIIANPEQTAALQRLERFLEADARTFTLVGRGGTGKTTIVRSVAERAEERGMRVGGGAVSHAAKEVLGAAIGVARSHTVAALLGIRLNESTGNFEPNEWARDRGLVPIRDYDVVVIDECSMISAEMMEEILAQAKPDARIIFMGDNVQLPPIGGGETESPTFTVSPPEHCARLSQRVRQGEESPIVALSDTIADNIEGSGVLRVLAPSDRVSNYDPETGRGLIFCSDEATAVGLLVDDLKRDPGNPQGAKAIVFNNERYRRSSQSVLNLNKTIRNALYGPEARVQFNPGEIVVAYAPWAPGKNEFPVIHNALSYVVRRVSRPYARTVRARWNGLKLNETYQAVDLSLEDWAGREVTVPVVEARDLPRFRADLEDRDKVKGALFFRLSEAFANVHYGYAVTSHKAQGSTYRNVYVFEDNILAGGGSAVVRNKSFYVAVTRASDKLVVHSRQGGDWTSDAAPVPGAPRTPGAPLPAGLTSQQRSLLEALRASGKIKMASELD